jgi:bacterioferritin-associated ferredoxin
MILCLCAGKSEHEIRALVAEGATSVRAIQRACGAGADCRACCPMLAALVAESAGMGRRDTTRGVRVGR